MPKYRVDRTYHIDETTVVEAKDEEDALIVAENTWGILWERTDEIYDSEKATEIKE